VILHGDTIAAREEDGPPTLSWSRWWR